MVNKTTVQTQDERPPIRSIQDIEADHPDEWVEIEVTTMADDGFTALEGRLVAHGKDREQSGLLASAYFKKFDVKSMYHNFLGEMQVEAVSL